MTARKDQRSAQRSAAAPSDPDDWGQRAACTAEDVDPDLFFKADQPDMELVVRGQTRDDKQREVDALAVCGRCPVIDECAAWAIQTGQRYGIWGGMNEVRLREMVKRHNALAKVAA